MLLTLGRLPVALDLARSFRAHGCRVIVADPFRMHLARMSTAVDRCYRVVSPGDHPEAYADALCRIIDHENVQLVVPVSEETMHVAKLVERVADGVRVFCSDQASMLALHDKYRFNRCAATHGLPVPRSCLATDPDAGTFTADTDFVSKPRLSSSGRNVRFHRAGESVTGNENLLLQERLTGPQVSSFSIFNDGKVFATTMYRGAVMDGSVAVCFEPVTDQPAIDNWIESFAAATRHTGFLSFDFILGDDETPLAIECNPRTTSGIHFLSAAAIAPAILGEQRAAAGDTTGHLLAESYSCFTAVLKRLLSGHGAGDAFSCLRSAGDVTWSRDDPWPFLLMMVNTSPILARSIRHRQTFAVSAVRDIEWRDVLTGAG